MSEPFIGEIRMFAGNFAPRGWALCDGQLMAVSQNDALFSLFGTIYGGDGRTTFGLPDMRGRIPIHAGQGPGLPNQKLGKKAGQESVTVNTNELPAHTHEFDAVNVAATATSPAGAETLAQSVGYDLYVPNQSLTPMSSGNVSEFGLGQNHNNMMPFQCVNFIVSLFGIYPSRH